MAIFEGDSDKRPAWFVGAAYDGTDDRTAAFVAEGIWHNGYRDKYNDLVLSMLPGRQNCYQGIVHSETWIAFRCAW